MTSEKSAWENVLKKAQRDNKRAERQWLREKEELEKVVEAKDAQVAVLQLEIRAQDALNEARKSGFDLDDGQDFHLKPPQDQDIDLSVDSRGYQNVTITDEIRENELLECQGELLHKTGSQRENSFIEIKYDEEADDLSD